MENKINWKTTLLGIGSIIAGAGVLTQVGIDFLDGKQIDQNTIAVGVGLITAGFAGIFAKDAK